MLPMDCKEVTESKGTAEVASGLVQSRKAEDQELNSFQSLEISRGTRLKLNASRRLTIGVEVDIQTGKTYMLYKSYICAME